MAEVRLEGIVKDYGGFRAIHDVDLDVADGEFVVFVGPSGCGKSTLLRMIAGLEEISAGRLTIGGRLVNEVEPRDRDVAMVFQDYALYPHMTIAENIGFGLRMRDWKKSDIERKVLESARILQIESLLDRRPAQLSGGQRQRAAMGRAIVREPSLFLFDEPLSNLDAKLRVEMRTQIKRLHAMLGTTTIYVTHDQTEALTLADRVVVLDEGRVVQEGHPLELYERPNCRFVGEFIGSPQMNILDAVIDRTGAQTMIRVGAASVPIHDLPLPDATHVDVGIRPEHIYWTSLDEGLLTPKIDVYEPLGSDTMAICDLDGQELTARLDPKVRIKRNEFIGLGFDADNLHFFDPRDGARIKPV
ncbi:ABC transporter ATP-binding protein [Aliiruegeria lutimaris]|uniref:Carbohydrate ABC transporter ATP-binding protein, CUT1 family n=1 Tax=Aliiruegeria lutimaris TaxID=571298 RepID=A0A1G8S5D0_9RHOB|nr:sn-glycerol-3-phosphate ABC transporter ATP-binding protein UgpC [Aliiruegeria lutimaris]SDJ24458.1 carbohydrate ABC transporter ATP-binding protein, CUT1 family [Aliiruegeria lutimaris]